MTTKLSNHSTEKRGVKPIVLIDKKHPQFFDFDKAVVFEEKAIKKKFAVELLDEKQSVTAAETSVLFTNSMRIVCAKNESIIAGIALQLNLTAIYKKLPHNYFLKIPCTLTKVENFKHITHAVLSFSDHVDPQFTAWYQQWLTKLKQANKSLDIDENAFNFIYQYYKRLYSTHLAYPVIFSDAQQIRYSYFSIQGSDGITFFDDDQSKFHLPFKVVQPYINLQTNNSRTPLYVWYENEHFYFFSNADHPELSPIKIISWLKGKPQWRVLLIRNRKIVPANEIQCKEIKGYVTEETITNSAQLEQTFSNLTTTTNVLDISCLFSQICLPEHTESIAANEPSLQETSVSYQLLSFIVKRSEPRFAYTTSVMLTTLNKHRNITISTQTTDISFLGLNIEIITTENCFKVGDSVIVEFTQWNENLPSSLFKKKEKLETVEYEIINLDIKLDAITLGVIRVKRDTHPKLNTYIQKIINDLKLTGTEGILNNLNLYQSLISSLWINNNIAGLPFYLGRDSEGLRIIQAIANTQENLKLRKPFEDHNDWSFLQKIAASLGVAVNNIHADKDNVFKQLNIGVYSYYDDISKSPEWNTQTDLDFKSAESKSSFISTAVTYKKHYFYHCSLIPIKSGKDHILNNESSSFVSIGAHRLKEIHEICRSLIAVGELNEVTRLIEFMYKPE